MHRGWRCSISARVSKCSASVFLDRINQRHFSALALLLGIWFLVHGILEINFSIQVRHHSRNWGLMLISGVVSIILSIIIWTGWPATALWIIGLLLGINLIFFGVSLFALAFRVKNKAT
jgi:uncharacterized membrane protein HdeD (DUF308 family)